ncbi:uncharacterized protein FTOL_11835 [Fusarium torulosum]|uniref:Uncharacterized protein n=1 Tax=Fusarium torulosum TaxID=33205 RepID=A0AAE8SN88_9HYPO|nr:uncharacterized protein FTOL_11835 [Fusarium torulosum]
MSLLARCVLVGLWASATCAQSYTVTVIETVTECASSCYSVVSQCTSTEYLDTSSGIKLPTGSSAIVSASETPTPITNIISLPTVSIPSASKFVNASSLTASYTSTPFGTETTIMVSESTGDVSAGSSALAGGTSSELESTLSSLYGYSTSTLTLGVGTSETVTNLETMPTIVPSVDSSALAPGTTQFSETGGSTTVPQGSTEQPSESSPSSAESIPTEGVSTGTYVPQQGSSTISEDSDSSTVIERGSTTTLQSALTSQITITESISTVYSVSTEQPVPSGESTGSIDISSQAAGASTQTWQNPATTEDVSSESTSLTQLTSQLTLTRTESLTESESSYVPEDTTGISVVESSNTYGTVTSEMDTATASTIKTLFSGASAGQTDSTASGASPESTSAGVPTGTTEVGQSTSTTCTSTKHTHVYGNTTVIHSTAQQGAGSSALAGSFTSTSSLETGYISATSDVVKQTTTPGAETSEGRPAISTSDYPKTTSGTAASVETSQTTVPSGTEESTPVESNAPSASSATTAAPSQPTQPIQTPGSPSTSSNEESTAPNGYDFGNPSSTNDGWPTASFASTADAATGLSSFTTLLTTSKITDTASSSTSTAVKEPEYEPPAYEPPSYREPAYVRKRWALRW